MIRERRKLYIENLGDCRKVFMRGIDIRLDKELLECRGRKIFGVFIGWK